MGKVRIQRSNESANRWRAYQLYIDGAKVGTIASGQTKEFNIGPGRHILYSKIDWCRSPEASFDVTTDEIKVYEVKGFKYADLLMFLVPVTIILSYVLNRIVGVDYFFYLNIPMVLILIYYLTIGRKKYLSLKEV
jgi:hypothetical protein